MLGCKYYNQQTRVVVNHVYYVLSKTLNTCTVYGILNLSKVVL